MSNIVTSKFTGLLRGLFRRFDDHGATIVASPHHVAATSSARSFLPATATQSRLQAAFTPAPAASPDGLQLPLPSIISVLPIDLRAKLLETPPSNAFISIPVEKVLSQLAHGAVKITFGELRAARPGLFASSGSENDVRQIVLPLNEIITRISPTLLSRRAAKKVEPTDDIAGPFGVRAQGVHFTTVQAQPRAATAPTPPAPKSASPATTFIRKSAVPAPGPVRIASVLEAPATAVSPAPIKPNISRPLSAPAAPIPFSSAPAAATANGFNSLPQIPVENPILVPLSTLAEKWPETIKTELVQSELMRAQAALPASLIEPGLKRGRVTILWKDLRVMLRPKPAQDSANDAVEVELPLHVLAPLYFANQKAAGQAKQKVSVAEEIPDLFIGSRQAEVSTSFMAAPQPAPVSPARAVPAAPASPAPVEAVISAPPTAPVTPAVPEQGTLSAPLAALSEKWPEALRQEIAQWNLTEAQVALPLNALGPAMKRGRAAFVWRDLRSWIQPAPAVAESVHDSIELELPLKVIAPLFLGRQTPATRPQSRLAVDQSIPSPFSSFALPEAKAPVITPAAAPIAVPTAAPAPKPTRPALKPVDAKLSETNFYVWGDTSDTPSVDESEYKRPQAPATDFTSRYATPKEIVARAMKLPGVAGVVVALCDGLMIASQVPPNLNADTAAAFLPQIFDRVAQCTRELRMGSLNNLKFTVGNVPWHIFHVNAIYFAAFGQTGESLPTAQLASLAGQLDRKRQ